MRTVSCECNEQLGSVERTTDAGACSRRGGAEKAKPLSYPGSQFENFRTEVKAGMLPAFAVGWGVLPEKAG
jgi:hypothetical protein